MPLDEFKTQVLLLHSEQSTLDTLSLGFGDSYTVHCATTGSEALNTLVDTPINVIVSAQELPGMSGLDALREAKKRSPDTIGILLAGNAGQGLEALVGDEEVFQVVRGNITSDVLHKLVDNATQQMRLMALAESANDTTANVDEPSQHIVMETSENGSTIISDGTGQFPQLDAQKVSASVNVGSRSVDILVLTKDQEFLETIKDSSRGMHTVHYANTLAQANETIREHKVGVAVVDAAMVGEKVEQLTMHLRKGSSRLVSIVAGRRDDGEMLMDLINRGKVYRFLLKPVSPGRARLAVEASVKHHLEAPDAAFKINGQTADTQAKPIPKPKPKPAQKAQAKPKAVPPPKQKTGERKPSESKPATRVPVDPPLGSAEPLADNSPISGGLGDAFGQDDSSFTETVTGLISSVTKKFKGDKESSATDLPSIEEIVIAESPASMDLDGGDGFGSSPFTNPKTLGIAGAAVVVVAAIAFWALSGSEPESVPQQAEVTESATAEADVTAAPVEDNLDLNALLSNARAARDSGQLFTPADNNAIDLFAAVLAAEPGNEVAASELAGVVQQALGMAETAMLESRIDDADDALRSVATVDAENPRLPFLQAQLAQMQLRAGLDGARRAIREGRFEDAAIAVAAARTVGVTDNTEIDAVAGELRDARQAITDRQAQEEAARNAATERQAAADQLAAEQQAAERQAAADKLVAEQQAVEQQAAADQLAAEQQAAEQQAAADQLAAEQQAAEQQAAADKLAAEQRATANVQQTAEPVGPPVSTPEQQAAVVQSPVPVSSLARTKYVAPKYPRNAQRRNQSGWVDVVFTVSMNGSVKDITVRDSEPGEVFVAAAVKAVEKWEFKPTFENGRLVEKKAGVRMMFALE